jgi:hypothetical protein
VIPHKCCLLLCSWKCSNLLCLVGLNGSFVTSFLRLPCHVKWNETWIKHSFSMESFIQWFHRYSISRLRELQPVRFTSLLWLKVLFAGLLWEKNAVGWLLIPLNSSNEHGVGNYAKRVSSLFLNTLSCHTKYLCDNLFNTNETPIKLPLRLGLPCLWLLYCLLDQVVESSLLFSLELYDRSVLSH